MFEKNLDFKFIFSRCSSDLGGHVGHLGARFSKKMLQKIISFFHAFSEPSEEHGEGGPEPRQGTFFSFRI